MNQIENLCKKLGFKQADLATYLGVSAQLLGMIASGKRKLPLGMLSRLEELDQICRIAEQKQPDAERTQLYVTSGNLPTQGYLKFSHQSNHGYGISQTRNCPV